MRDFKENAPTKSWPLKNAAKLKFMQKTPKAKHLLPIGIPLIFGPNFNLKNGFAST